MISLIIPRFSVRIRATVFGPSPLRIPSGRQLREIWEVLRIFLLVFLKVFHTFSILKRNLSKLSFIRQRWSAGRPNWLKFERSKMQEKLRGTTNFFRWFFLKVYNFGISKQKLGRASSICQQSGLSRPNWQTFEGKPISIIYSVRQNHQLRMMYFKRLFRHPDSRCEKFAGLRNYLAGLPRILADIGIESLTHSHIPAYLALRVETFSNIGKLLKREVNIRDSPFNMKNKFIY